ncbi:hypothetical protein AX17_004239 [Amanita inopinata Kibby_2008]|nr:hypothetical protein AX17_004239 [Amanita inopinata Kibby_2008]
MRIDALSILVAGTALAVVEAAPLRVVVVTNNQELSQSLRFGHAVPPTSMGIRITNIASTSEPSLAGPAGHPANKRPCIMRKMRDKAIGISNVFRQAFGLPLIETTSRNRHDNNHASEGVYRILPFVGTEPSFIEVKGQSEQGGIEGVTRGGDPIRILPFDGQPPIDDASVRHHKHHKYHGLKLYKHSSFLKRLNAALMSLGPWEGRAIAFVLGCGIGVLLRMLWVLCVVTFRALKGNKEEVEYTVIDEYIGDDAETIIVPPPTYTYVDEKPEAKKNTTDMT